MPKGLHFIGQLKVKLSADVFTPPGDKDAMLAAEEQNNMPVFDLSADLEVKEDGLYWTIRLPKMNTSHGMIAMQACKSCAVS